MPVDAAATAIDVAEQAVDSRLEPDADGGVAAGSADGDAADADAPERGPLRRCVVTRESGPKEGMLRFVLSPDRVLVADLAGRLPGRGMWLSARGDVLERGIARGAFARAARGPVTVPPGLRDGIVSGLRARVRDFVGFARRGGHAICGREAVREWLRAGRVGLLVEAAEGSAAERERLLAGRAIPIMALLTAAELGAVFGRDHVVHAAVARGRMAAAVAAEAARLAGVLGLAGVQGLGTYGGDAAGALPATAADGDRVRTTDE